MTEHPRTSYTSTPLGEDDSSFPMKWPDSSEKMKYDSDFYWGKDDFYYVPTAEDLQFEQEEYEAGLQVIAEGVDRMMDDIANADSNDAKYTAVRTYLDSIRNVFVGYIGNSKSQLALMSFTALEEAGQQTNSVYIHRLVDWGQQSALHNMIPLDALEPDPDKSNSTALEHWQYDSWLSEKDLRGLVWRPTPETEQFLVDNPEYRRAYQAAAEVMAHDVNLGDDDYNAPDPYRALGVLEMQKVPSINASEVELATETSHLLGVAIEDISEGARQQLFHVGVNLDRATYERIEDVVEKMPSADRIVFAEAFLATEFGDDFGDILLDIAESISLEKLTPVLEGIDRMRRAGSRIAEQFRSGDELDDVIADRLPTAFAKRTTELLALARVEDPDEIIEPLSAIADATEMIAGSVEHDSFSHADVTPDFASFRSNTSPVVVGARPHGHNARLGFTVKMRGQRLNTRLDYEDGELSLDIGSTARSGVAVSDIARTVGTSLARGELALAQYRVEQSILDETETPRHQTVELHGNHVREAFADMPRLQPEEFAGVVNRFMYRLWYRDRVRSVGGTTTAAIAREKAA